MFFKTVLCFALVLFLAQQSYADEFSVLMERHKNSTNIQERAVLAEQIKVLGYNELSHTKQYQNTRPLPSNGAVKIKKGFIYFEDGRVCENCVVYTSPNGFITSVKDSKGVEWLTEQNQKIIVDSHPYLRRFSALSTRRRAVQTNCTSFGDSINCRSTHY